MTKREYEKLYRAARSRFPTVQRQTMAALHDIYAEAGKQAAEAVADAELRGLSDITVDSWRSIQISLESGASSIAEACETEITNGVSKAYYQTAQNPGYALIDAEYIIDAFEAAGSSSVTRSGLASLMGAVNDRLIVSMVNRQYSSGYTFVESIWNTFKEGKNGTMIPSGIFGDYQYRVENLIRCGLAQGRDPIKIASDIELYVKKSYLDAGVNTKDLIFKPGRYGKLKPGTAQYRARIASRPDWRALRLVRSELYHTMQDAAKQQGLANPAVIDAYDWIKTPGNPVDPDGSRNASGKRCIDLMDQNPYKLSDVPDYQHPNCQCRIQPNLMDGVEFRADIQKWVSGEPVGYLDQWYNGQYLPSQTR